METSVWSGSGHLVTHVASPGCGWGVRSEVNATQSSWAEWVTMEWSKNEFPKERTLGSRSTSSYTDPSLGFLASSLEDLPLFLHRQSRLSSFPKLLCPLSPRDSPCQHYFTPEQNPALKLVVFICPVFSESNLALCTKFWMFLSFDPAVRHLEIYPRDKCSKTAKTYTQKDSLWVSVDNSDHGITERSSTREGSNKLWRRQTKNGPAAI